MSQLKIERGTTYTMSVNYQRNGAAATLVGATVRFTMKTSEYDADTDDSDASLVKNVTDGTAEGTAEIAITPDDTATLIPGKFYYDVKVEDADSNVYLIDEGTIKLGGSPTNRLS